VDYIVSSLDKNFMIPVGGACVMSPSEDCIAALSKSYPGRASITPILDLFITLLSMGKSQLVELLDRRDALFSRLKDGLGAITALYGERVLLSPNNPISIGITLSFAAEASTDECTRFGSMLFQRCVSGARVVPTGSTTTIGGYEFIGWGAHSSVYSVSYLTAACAIGMTEGEIEIFLEKLGKVFKSEKQRVESLSTVRTQGSSKDFNIL
jgi:O-phospho-L-seryl-tRNASec:L-selenocysteinyl-tRNA synthase